MIWGNFLHILSVQFSHSVVSNSLQPQGLQHARPPCPSPTPRVYSNSSIEMPSNHLILCHPLLPPSILPSIRVFSNESVPHIRWPSSSNEYSGLISFRMDWLDLFAVQGFSQESSPTPVGRDKYKSTATGQDGTVASELRKREVVL